MVRLFKSGHGSPSTSDAEPTSDSTASSTTGDEPMTTDQKPATQTDPSPTEDSAATTHEAASADATDADTGNSNAPIATTSSAGSRKADAKSSHKKEKAAAAAKKVKAGSDLVRNRIASVVWLIAVLAAVILAVGALLIALDANKSNEIVSWVLNAAEAIDGPFWKVFEFNGEDAATKTHLVNWGLAAIAYLIVGRIADRIIRP